MNEYKIKLSGILAELNVRSINTNTYNRNGGRKNKLVSVISKNNLSEEELTYQQNVQARSIANALRKFKRLVYANFSYGFTFLTLTFNQECSFDITDNTTCREKFSNYWKNLKRGTKAHEKIDDTVDMRYLGVEEFHKDGSIHYHVLCHIPRKYAPLLKKKWRHGFVDFQRFRKDPLSIQRIANYMKKGIFDPRLNNQKQRYLPSRGLKQPIIFKFTSVHIPDWLNNNSDLIYEEDSQYGFHYAQYITTLTEDEFHSYVESANDAELQYLIEQMQMIQQLKPVA